MTKVVFAAKKINRHPIWYNVYNKAEIQLFTHEAKDTITDKDIKLSKKIDKFFNKE